MKDKMVEKIASYVLADLNKIDVNSIIDYESGDLDEEQTIELFQKLIDTGVIMHLQGSYQRMANDLINQGLCHR